MKKTIALLLLCSTLFTLTACRGSQPSNGPSPQMETVTFTDSLGHLVEVPAQIDRVALSGPMAQIVLFALCPDKCMGLASEWDPEADQYIDTEYYNLPTLGQLYGSSAG